MVGEDSSDMKSKETSSQGVISPPPMIVVIFVLVLFALLAAFGIYLMLFADWFDLGLPLFLMGMIMIVGYFSLRRAVKRSVREKSSQK